MEAAEPATSSRPSNRPIWIGALSSVVALLLLFWRVRLRDLGTAIAGAHSGWLVLAAAVFFVMFLVRAWRWSLMLGKTPFWATWHANIIGYFFNMTLPLRVGELARGYVISKSGGITLTRAMSIVIAERLVDLAAVLLLFAGFALRIPMRPAFTRAATIGSAAVVLALVAAVVVVVKGAAIERLLERRLARFGEARAKAVTSKLTQIRESLQAIGAPRILAPTLLLTAVVWLLTIAFCWLCMKAFLPEGTFEQAGLVVVIGNLGGALPSAPGGLGIVQGFATSALVVPFGIDESVAVAFVFVWSLGAQLALIALGFVSLGRVGLSFREIRAGAARGGD
ncbi:MAG: flippase-like domain-containing protein [Labilithrix sp.]|nr:flippase-like domain-containing protein [Labilithrix sp.]MCW5810498.1 flippase-like domain-containing protein [Labilithrix sp.]